MSTWATKYRPTELKDVLGQEHAAKAIEHILNTNSFHPVYMVTGAYGSGKTTILRVFAMALTCTMVTRGEGCGRCNACVGLIENQHNDNYVEIDAADHSSVEDVRQLIKTSTLTLTGSARRRVVLMDECHMLTKAAQNALLKLLEEGSPSTTYMLATTDREKLLPTIASRAIKWGIRPIPREKIQQKLQEIATNEGVETEAGALKLIVQYKKGHVRDSIMLLEQAALLGGVTTKSVMEYLELDKDREVARILIMMATNSEDAMKQVEGMMTRITPEALWKSVRRILSEALRVRTTTEQDHPLQGILEEITNTFRDTIENTVEWLMSSAMVPETTTETICALTILQSRLVLERKTKAIGQVRAGIPVRYLEKAANAVVEQEMTQDQFAKRMSLVPEKDTVGVIKSLSPETGVEDAPF